MPTSAGPDIVQNGLVLELDAADRNSYVSGSTTWFDLSGNSNNGTLINGPTFNTGSSGNIVFDGVDDSYSIGNNTSLDCANAVSVFVWAKTPSSYIAKEIIMKYPSVNIGIPYGFQWWSDGNLYFHITTSVGWKEIQGLSGYNLNTWYYMGLTYDQTTLRIYINGSPTTTAAQTGTINTNTYPIICSPGLGGSLANIQLYNRTLSAAEIKQNYNAQKSRFGL